MASAFVLAAVAEAVARHRATPGLMAFDGTGALWLCVLAVRRTRPLLTICVLAGAGLLGTIVTALAWPQAQDGAGVWILAMMLACYSLGAHAGGRVVVLGGCCPWPW